MSQFPHAFGEWDDANPGIAGEPVGPMIQVDSDNVVQKTTTGILWYKAGEGVTFYVPDERLNLKDELLKLLDSRPELGREPVILLWHPDKGLEIFAAQTLN